MKPSEFASRNVYIVGGSAGIGLAIACKTAALGAHVTIFARRAPLLESATAAVRAARKNSSQSVLYRVMDAADHARVIAVMSATVADVGPPDVLINCAGRALPRRFEEVTYEQFEETMRVNVHGCWNTVQAVLPHMKGRGGYIVNTSSVAGLIGVFGYTDYCASKFALIGFSEALRSELKPHDICVSVLCPPDTDTPGFENENRTKPEETRAISGTAKVMTADAVADVLLRGMAKRQFLIVPGLEGRLSVLAKRLFPGVVAWVMDRTIAQVGRSRNAR
jgi:NAD(P)-dependent dehydrogenase (short-subunit alcohol dehydrogenase family)